MLEGSATIDWAKRSHPSYQEETNVMEVALPATENREKK